MIVIELLEQYMGEILVISLLGILGFMGFASVSKYYIFPEVHTKAKRGRATNYLGRKVRYKKMPKNKDVKGVLKIMDRGWFNAATTKITIPNGVNISKPSPTKFVIYARNIRYDYKKFNSFIPTHKEFSAIHPDESVFTTELINKITNADGEVRKATSANPEVSKWQKTSGSIPLSALNEDENRVLRKLDNIGNVGSEEKYEESEESEESKEGVEEDKKPQSEGSYSREDAEKDLANVLQGGGD